MIGEVKLVSYLVPKRILQYFDLLTKFNYRIPHITRYRDQANKENRTIFLYNYVSKTVTINLLISMDV